MPFFDQSRKGSLNQDVVQHFAKPLHKVTNHRRNGKIRHWTWPCIRGSKFLHIILFFCIARIGEAQNPGPTIGTINPSGALGKGHLFQDLPNVDQFNAWGIAETHLTNPGLVKFRQELHHQPDPWRFTPGAPAPPLTSSPGVVGGKATGVGLLSTCPARPLAGRWKTEDWQTGRIQTVAAFVQHQWLRWVFSTVLQKMPIQKQFRKNQINSCPTSLIESYDSLRAIEPSWGISTKLPKLLRSLKSGEHTGSKRFRA